MRRDPAVDQALAGADAKLRGADRTASRDDATPEEIDNACTSVGDAINLATKAFLRYRGRPTGDDSWPNHLREVLRMLDRGGITHPPTDLLVEVIYERNESVHDGSFAVTEVGELDAAIALARRYLDAVRRAT